jgi:hypothetical protein
MPPRIRRAALLTGLGALLLAPPIASAGPPLITDDPGTAGHRSLEIISGVRATERGSDATFKGTLLDLAYGLFPGFELDATFDLTHTDHDKDEDGSFEYSGAPAAFGFKWQLIESEHFAAAIAPSVDFNLDGGDDLAGALFGLTEARVQRWRLGAAGGYVPRDDARDGWLGGVYSGLGFGEGSEIVTEVHFAAFREHDNPEIGWNLGLDLALSPSFRLLTAGGTGIDGGHGSRREWDAYLGFQLFLGPFGETPVNAPPPRVRPGSLAGGDLLELTDRQKPLSRRSGRLSR